MSMLRSVRLCRFTVFVNMWLANTGSFAGVAGADRISTDPPSACGNWLKRARGLILTVKRSKRNVTRGNGSKLTSLLMRRGGIADRGQIEKFCTSICILTFDRRTLDNGEVALASARAGRGLRTNGSGGCHRGRLQKGHAPVRQELSGLGTGTFND